MSLTEQLGLVSKFGNELQNAITSRFDRVERTLAQMERFLAFQKPLLRLDAYIELTEPMTSAALADEAVLLIISGLHTILDVSYFLYVNHPSHPRSKSEIVTSAYMWSDGYAGDNPPVHTSASPVNDMMSSFMEISLMNRQQPVRVVDLTVLRFRAMSTEGIKDKIKKVTWEVNGYELFSCPTNGEGEAIDVEWPDALPYEASERNWVSLVKPTMRNLLFDPPELSGRFLPTRTSDQ